MTDDMIELERLIASGEAVLTHDHQWVFANIDGTRVQAGRAVTDEDGFVTAILPSGTRIPMGGGHHD